MEGLQQPPPRPGAPAPAEAAHDLLLNIQQGTQVAQQRQQQNQNSNNDETSNQTIHVGTPRHPTGWSNATIHFHNFREMPTKKGDSVDSDPFRVHGLYWYLRIHPGGAASANGDGMISLYLRCKSAAESNVAVQAEFSLALLRNDKQIDSMMSCPLNAFRRKRKGWPNFISRSRVLDSSSQLLDDHGTLTVLVKIQLLQEGDVNNFVPKNDIGVGLVRLLREVNSKLQLDQYDSRVEEESSTANTADVKFLVEGDEIYAHRLILKLGAPALAQLCEDADADEDTAIPIPRVRSPIFQGLLRFAYGDAVPDDVWNMTTTSLVGADAGSDNDEDDQEDSNNTGEPSVLDTPAMQLLDAANRYGVVGLKILAETKVAEAEISVSNASDLILYADAFHCPLLKEKVVDYFIAHANEIRKHPSYQKVRESASIQDELMDALLNKRILRLFSLGDNDVDYDSMGVNLLRRKLDGRGLDVDGSREMLTQRLVEWDRTNARDSKA